MRERGTVPRETGDILCGRELPSVHGWAIISNRISRRFSDAESRDLHVTYNALRHIQFKILAPQNNNNDNRDNSDLRLRYLLGKLTLDDWKRELMLRKSRVEKDVAFRAVYATVHEAGLEILTGIIDHPTTRLTPGLQEIEALFQYTNTELKALQRRFNNRAAYILPNIFYCSKNALL
jgi:hypothetical protein